MRIEIINLEEKILNNQTYLFEYYPNTKMLIEQISMILDFGMNNDKIKEWFRLNKIAIDIIENLIERHNNK